RTPSQTTGFSGAAAKSSILHSPGSVFANHLAITNLLLCTPRQKSQFSTFAAPAEQSDQRTVFLALTPADDAPVLHPRGLISDSLRPLPAQLASTQNPACFPASPEHPSH